MLFSSCGSDLVSVNTASPKRNDAETKKRSEETGRGGKEVVAEAAVGVLKKSEGKAVRGTLGDWRLGLFCPHAL